MMELVRGKQVLFKYASELLRSDRELLESALDISDCGNDIRKVWKKLSHSNSIHDGLVRLFRYPRRIFRYCTDDKLRNDTELISKAAQFKSNRELIKQAVYHHGAILAYIDSKYKSDEEIVLIALKTSHNRLWSIPKDIRNSLDFSLKVATFNYRNQQYDTYFKSLGEEFWAIIIQKKLLSSLLPLQLYNSKYLMKIVLERKGSLLEKCSDSIRDDLEMVKSAISNDIDNLKYASQRIRECEELKGILSENLVFNRSKLKKNL